MLKRSHSNGLCYIPDSLNRGAEITQTSGAFSRRLTFLGELKDKQPWNLPTTTYHITKNESGKANYQEGSYKDEDRFAHFLGLCDTILHR